MAEGLGASLESVYFAFGDTDAYVVLDLPDNQTAAAASIAVNTAGGAASEVVVLLSPVNRNRKRRQFQEPKSAPPWRRLNLGWLGSAGGVLCSEP